MPLDEWLDVPAIKVLCRHTSTFGLGVLIAVLGKPFLLLAEKIGEACREPMAGWLTHSLAVGDDLVIAYFSLCLVIKLALELWPRRHHTHPMFLAAGIYGVLHYA